MLPGLDLGSLLEFTHLIPELFAFRVCQPGALRCLTSELSGLFSECTGLLLECARPLSGSHLGIGAFSLSLSLSIFRFLSRSLALTLGGFNGFR